MTWLTFQLDGCAPCFSRTGKYTRVASRNTHRSHVLPCASVKGKQQRATETSTSYYVLCFHGVGTLWCSSGLGGCWAKRTERSFLFPKASMVIRAVRPPYSVALLCTRGPCASSREIWRVQTNKELPADRYWGEVYIMLAHYRRPVSWSRFDIHTQTATPRLCAFCPVGRCATSRNETRSNR